MWMGGYYLHEYHKMPREVITLLFKCSSIHGASYLPYGGIRMCHTFLGITFQTFTHNYYPMFVAQTVGDRNTTYQASV